MENKITKQKLEEIYNSNRILILTILIITFFGYQIPRIFILKSDNLGFYLFDIFSNLNGILMTFLLINFRREQLQKKENQLFVISFGYFIIGMLSNSLSNNSIELVGSTFEILASVFNFQLFNKLAWMIIIVSFLKIAQDNYETRKEVVLATLFAAPILILFLIPAFETENTRFYLDTFTRIFIFSAFALTLNLEIGYLGLPNFGKVAFMAIGGYTYALVEFNDVRTFGSIFVTGMIYAFFVTGFFGVIMTIPTLRLREDYFAIVTIVAGEIIRIVLLNEREWSQGHGGIGITNIFFESKNVDQVMDKFFLDLTPLLWLSGILALEYALYRYYFNQFLTHYNTSKALNYSLQKVISVSVFFSILTIFMNYSGTFLVVKNNPSLGLDLFSIALPVVFIIYNYFKFNPKNTNRLFMGIFVSFLISFIVGLTTGNNWHSNINNVNWYFMLFSFFIMLIVFVIMQELYYSPFGRTLRAIREDDTSAISVGKNLFQFRVKGLFISNALTGLIGAIYALSLFHITPDNYRPILTFQLYIMIIIGGTGNNKGVIYGGVLISILFSTTRKLSNDQNRVYYPFFSKRNYLDMNQVDPFNLSLIIVGVALIVFLIYGPGGIFPEKSQNNERYNDLLYLNKEDPEKIQDDLLLNMLIKLSRSKLDPQQKEESR